MSITEEIVQAESEFQDSIIHKTFDGNIVPSTSSSSSRQIETTLSSSKNNSNKFSESYEERMVEITAITPHYFDFLKLIGLFNI